jgi:hypothetical protein
MADPQLHPPHWTDKLQSFDRRWIFLAMSLAVVVPLFFPLNLPARPDPMTKAAFNAVESLPQGARVFVSMDFDPASTPEIEPFYRAVMLQLKRKEARVAVATIWYQAPPLVERLIRETIDVAIAPPGTAATAASTTGPTRPTSTTPTSASATARAR